MKIEIDLDEKTARVLTAIGKTAHASKTPDDTIRYLISSVMDGVRRPGSWERQVLYSLFGDLDEAEREFWREPT